MSGIVLSFIAVSSGGGVITVTGTSAFSGAPIADVGFAG